MNLRRLGPRLASALLLAGLASCAVDQNKEVGLYRKVLDANTPASQPFDAARPLTLTQAVLLANQNDEHLRLSGETYLQALVARDEAFSAFLPLISLGPSYTYSELKPTSGGASKVVVNNFAIPVNGQINILNGFRDAASFYRATATAEQQKQLLLDMRQTILLETAQAYYQVLLDEQSVEVLSDSAKLQDARVSDIRARHSAGLARPLDVAQTEANDSATRVQLLQAVAAVSNGRSTLAFLTAAPVEQTPLLDDFQPPPRRLTLPEMIAQAEENRQDLLAADSAFEAARQNVMNAIGQYYPSVSINVQYFLYRVNVPSPAEWMGLLQANIPLYTGGQIEASVRIAWSQLRQALLTENLLRRQIANDVSVAYVNLISTEDQLQQLQVEFKAAEEAYREADQSYAVGLTTNLDVLTAQNTLLSTRLQLTSEQFQRKMAYLQLVRETGRLPVVFPISPQATTGPTTLPMTQP